LSAIKREPIAWPGLCRSLPNADEGEEVSPPICSTRRADASYAIAQIVDFALEERAALNF